jgi:hypothetical protein
MLVQNDAYLFQLSYYICRNRKVCEKNKKAIKEKFQPPSQKLFTFLCPGYKKVKSPFDSCLGLIKVKRRLDPQFKNPQSAGR